MHVLVDATAIPDNLAGVGRYVDDLLPALTGVRISIVARGVHAAHFARKVPGARILDVGGALDSRLARMRWEQTTFPAIARASGCDVQLSPHYTMPVRHVLPTVVTLHDATFFTMPEVHERTKRVFFRAATRYAVRHADALVVPSLATRDEVIAATGVNGRKDDFFVAYHGVDTGRFHPVPPADAERVAAGLGVPAGGYVAFLGTLEPRKNVPALIRGWVRAFEDWTQPPPLVLAGMKGWDASIEEVVARVPQHMRIVTPGYLPLEDLPGFLSGAMILAYPSLGEGFGLPVLEAMACGACTLTTPILSLPEVGGQAVAYCGTSHEEIAAELVALAGDPARRAALGRAAIERAAGFTWAASARSHVEAFEHAARHP
ncbi:MAG: glycosyltransferase family 1 protein [Actinomycetaceae bacterium]|nr:glycosyltransferase family 1 protein [Actinomycetaceae bacterium]